MTLPIATNDWAPNTSIKLTTFSMKLFHQIENKKTYILENINRSKCSMTKMHENNLTRAWKEEIKVLGEGLFNIGQLTLVLCIN